MSGLTGIVGPDRDCRAWPGLSGLTGWLRMVCRTWR